MTEKPSNSYLARRFDEATLEEHQRSDLEQESLGPLGFELRGFLGEPIHEQVIVHSSHCGYDLPQVHYSLAACFPEWELVREIGGRGYGSPLMAENHRVLVRPGKYEDFLSNGCRLYQLPEGRRALLIESRQGAITVSLLGLKQQRETLLADLNKLCGHIRKNHYLRGQTLRPSGSVISGMKPIALDDIAFTPETRAALLRNTVEFMQMREVFREYGVPQKRGVLLHGPPGTGKTMVARALAHMKLGTFIYLSSADLEDNCTLREVFQLARRLRPTVIFMEDLDLYAGSRWYLTAREMGELLAQMDGLEENDGILVIATTNDLDAIEPALKDRPSRFDVVLEIGLPSPQQRKYILQKNLARVPLAADLLELAVEDTEDFSGAQVKELAVMLMQQALFDMKEACSEAPRIDRATLEKCLAKLQGPRPERVVEGFAAQSKSRTTSESPAPGTLAGQGPLT